jgi:pyridoxamine 5'-phosphate oxidase
MEITPIEHFRKWFTEEMNLTRLKIPMACCLSTVGTDGFPNARFVSLKGIVENKLVVTGNLTSRKGIEINNSGKVALTFWWTETERQVRIQGTAEIISEALADKYFSERNRDSQIVSIVSDQGQVIDDMEALNQKYADVERKFSTQPLERPNNWGGYAIEPVRIEFLEFRQSRFHDRKLFELINGQWETKQLQP